MIGDILPPDELPPSPNDAVLAALTAEAFAAAEADPVAAHEIAYLTPDLVNDAAEWRVGLAESLERAGYTTAEDFLEAVGIDPPVTGVTDATGSETPADAWATGSALAAAEAFLCRYVAFASEHEAVAIALWIAHAHLVEEFDVSPILTVTSAELRSGKTRVLDCLELLVPRPFRAVIPSEAVVYTILSQRPRPTLLLDEADAIFGPRTSEKYEGLRAILNSGNRRGTPVLRVKLDGRRREVEEFDVFGPKAIAGIGRLPSTVADRAVPIRMRRRSPTEVVARFRQRIAAVEARQLAIDWSSVTVATDVTVPEELNDRAADSWEPLIAIADAVGGSWPRRARLAAVALSAEEDDQLSVGIRLLGDIRDVFGDGSHLPTSELLRRLHELEEAPWGDWYGKPLTPRALARLLEPYRIIPLLKRVGGGRSRGYFRSEFKDVWARYVPESASEGKTPNPVEGSGAVDDGVAATVTAVTPATSADALSIARSVWGHDLLEPEVAS